MILLSRLPEQQNCSFLFRQLSAVLHQPDVIGIHALRHGACIHVFSVPAGIQGVGFKEYAAPAIEDGHSVLLGSAELEDGPELGVEAAGHEGVGYENLCGLLYAGVVGPGADGADAAWGDSDIGGSHDVVAGDGLGGVADVDLVTEGSGVYGAGDEFFSAVDDAKHFVVDDLAGGIVVGGPGEDIIAAGQGFGRKCDRSGNVRGSEGVAQVGSLYLVVAGLADQDGVCVEEVVGVAEGEVGVGFNDGGQIEAVPGAVDGEGADLGAGIPDPGQLHGVGGGDGGIEQGKFSDRLYEVRGLTDHIGTRKEVGAGLVGPNEEAIGIHIIGIFEDEGCSVGGQGSYSGKVTTVGAEPDLVPVDAAGPVCVEIPLHADGLFAFVDIGDVGQDGAVRFGEEAGIAAAVEAVYKIGFHLFFDVGIRVDEGASAGHGVDYGGACRCLPVNDVGENFRRRAFQPLYFNATFADRYKLDRASCRDFIVQGVGREHGFSRAVKVTLHEIEPIPSGGSGVKKGGGGLIGNDGHGIEGTAESQATEDRITVEKAAGIDGIVPFQRIVADTKQFGSNDLGLQPRAGQQKQCREQ